MQKQYCGHEEKRLPHHHHPFIKKELRCQASSDYAPLSHEKVCCRRWKTQSGCVELWFTLWTFQPLAEMTIVLNRRANNSYLPGLRAVALVGTDRREFPE